MVSCVASVEVQVRGDEAPGSMDVGVAWSDTLGWAGGGAEGRVDGCVDVTGFLLHPKVKTAATTTTKTHARYSDRETSIIRILLRKVIPVFVPPESTS